MNHRGFSSIALVIIVILLALIGVSVYAFSNGFLASSTPEDKQAEQTLSIENEEEGLTVENVPVQQAESYLSKTDNSASWGSYKHPTCNYSFEYPRTFADADGVIYDVNVKKDESTLSTALLSIQLEQGPTTLLGISLDQSPWTIDELFKRYDNPLNEGLERITLHGKPALKLSTSLFVVEVKNGKISLVTGPNSATENRSFSDAEVKRVLDSIVVPKVVPVGCKDTKDYLGEEDRSRNEIVSPLRTGVEFYHEINGQCLATLAEINGWSQISSYYKAEIKYAKNNDATECHLGILLSSEDNVPQVLDSDFNSKVLGWINGFNGTVPGFYDAYFGLQGFEPGGY